MRKMRVGDLVYWVSKDTRELESDRVKRVSGAYLMMSRGYFAVPDSWVARTPRTAWKHFVEEMLESARALEKSARKFRRLAKLGDERAKEKS